MDNHWWWWWWWWWSTLTLNRKRICAVWFALPRRIVPLFFAVSFLYNVINVTHSTSFHSRMKRCFLKVWVHCAPVFIARKAKMKWNQFNGFSVSLRRSVQLSLHLSGTGEDLCRQRARVSRESLCRQREPVSSERDYVPKESLFHQREGVSPDPVTPRKSLCRQLCCNVARIFT